MTTEGVLSHGRIEAIYTKRARRYEQSVLIYNLFGMRLERWRRVAVDSLGLKPGDTVVDLACGTGVNFPLIREKIGPEGRIIGVDLTQAMLDQAAARVKDRDWENVELVCSRGEDFEFPTGVDAVFTSYALTLMPEFDEIVRKAARALAPGGRFVNLDMKLAESWVSIFAPLLTSLIIRPYAGTLEMARRRQPWKSVEKYMDRVSMREFYFGFVYIVVGESRGASQSE